MRFATDLGVSVWVWVPPSPINSNAICTGNAASCHLISQNHRITIRTVEVGRDLWWSAGPTLLIKQGYLENRVSPQHVYRDFINYLIHHFVPEMSLNWLYLILKSLSNSQLSQIQLSCPFTAAKIICFHLHITQCLLSEDSKQQHESHSQFAIILCNLSLSHLFIGHCLLLCDDEYNCPVCQNESLEDK